MAQLRIPVDAQRFEKAMSWKDYVAQMGDTRARTEENYHNAARDGGFAPEVVRLTDLLSGISLGIEASLAAGEDADESWWPDVRVTPAEIRDLLMRERPKS